MGKAWYFIIGIFIILLIIAGYLAYDIYFKEDISNNGDSDNNIPSNSNNNDSDNGGSDIVSDIICDSDTYNCDDFSTCEDVMEVFNECGGSDNDIHKLDNDGDGVPCEGICGGE